MIFPITPMAPSLDTLVINIDLRTILGLVCIALLVYPISLVIEEIERRRIAQLGAEVGRLREGQQMTCKYRGASKVIADTNREANESLYIPRRLREEK